MVRRQPETQAAPDAPLFVATDVAEYAHDIFAMLGECGFARVEMAVPGAEETGFARRFRAMGKPIHAGAFVGRTDGSPLHRGQTTGVGYAH